MTDKPAKPLNAKAYGSIGHLPKSRIGPGDHFVHEGQQTICTVKPRKGDRIIVTEKLDGACMAVAKINGELVALSRAGYRAKDALYDHLRLFDSYVADHAASFDNLLQDGERIVGEWLAMAHGTIYDPAHAAFSPFVAFDIFRDGKRVLFDEFRARVDRASIARASVLHDAPLAFPIEGALERLVGSHATGFKWKGYHGATEDVEGAVWRVEREGAVDFLAKYVRHDKTDGKYLPNISNAVLAAAKGRSMNPKDLRDIADKLRAVIDRQIDSRRTLNTLFMRAWGLGALDQLWRSLRDEFGRDKLHCLQYFIRARYTGDIKLGRTNAIEGRFSGLLSALPRGADLIACYPARLEHELELKREFQEYSIRGEWFYARGDLIRYLRLLGVDPDSFTDEPFPHFVRGRGFKAGWLS